MEYEEYIEKREELTKEVAKKRKEYAEAKISLRKLEKSYAYQIAKQYDKYIGKKVVYYYKNSVGSEVKSPIGYLKMFKWYAGNMFIPDGLYPFLSKVKKDGSMSNAMYPEFDNTRATVNNIIRMEIVE